MNKNIRKINAILTLAAFIITSIMTITPATAWAEGETPTEPLPTPTIKLSAANPIKTVASSPVVQLQFELSNVVKDDTVVINFPTKKDAKQSYLIAAQSPSASGDYTLKSGDNMVTKKLTVGSSSDEPIVLPINVKYSDIALADSGEKLIFAYSVNNKTAGDQEITLQIEAGSINWTASTDQSRNTSILSADKEEFQEAVPQYLTGNATLTLRDAYGNATQKVKSGDSLYIWIKSNVGDKLAEIYTAENSGSGTTPSADPNKIVLANCTLERVGNQNIYRITKINADTLDFPFRIKEDEGAVYTVHAAQATTATTDANVIKKLTTTLANLPTVNMTFGKLNIVDLGDITTHVSGDAPGSIVVEVSPMNGVTQEIRLPNGFHTKDQGEHEAIDPDTGETVVLVPVKSGSQTMKIIAVPPGGSQIYTEKNNDDFALYVDGERYKPTKMKCEITVNNASLTAAITNKLAFRYGTDEEVLPKTLDFKISAFQGSPTQIYIDFPQKAKGTADTDVKPQGYDKLKKVTDAAGNSYWRVVKNFNPGTQPVDVPIPLETLVKQDEGYDKTMRFNISLLDGSDRIYETGTVDLRYRVTDKIVSLAESSITAPVEQQEFVDAEGHTVYQTTATVKINSNVLNGRKLYAWVDREKASGGNGDQLAKARFEIKIDNDKMPAGNKNQLRTINSLVDEGTAAGSNNLFAITNIAENALDDDLNIASSEGGDYEIPLVITSLMPGEQFYIRVAVGETAQQAYVSSAQLESDPFDFVGVGEQPILTLSNNGIIYDSKPYGSIHYQLENISGLQAGDEIKIGLPAALDKPASAVGVSTREDTGESGGTTPEPDPGEDDKPTNIRPTVQWLTVKLGQPDNNGIYSGDISLGDTYIKEIAADDEGKKESVEIAIDDNSGCYLQVGNKNWSPMFFKGLLTITPRPPEADIAVSFAPKSGITVSANDKKQLVSGNTAVVDMTLTDRRDDAGASFGESVLLVWLEDDGQILKDTSHITFDLTKHPAIPAITEKAKSGQQALTIFKTPEEKAKTVTIPVTLQNLTDLGEYQLKAQLVMPTIEDGKIIGYDPGINRASGFVFDVIAAPAEAWQIKTIIANGDTLSGSAANVFTAGYQKVDTELSIKVLLQDKDGKPLAGKSISNASLDTTNKLTLSPTTAVTDKDGYAAFTVTPTIEGTFNIRLTAQEDRADMAMATLQIPVNQEGGGSSNVPDYYDLEIRRMTSTVARDGRASIYIEVFDRDDDQIMVTTSDMVNKIISSVRLTEIPSTSDLTRSSISVRRLGHGIEVYFVPDVAGSYEVTINGGGTNTPVLRPDITAVRQGKVVEMELEYPESTLRIGQSSSPAIVYTYDADGVKAEKALTANGMEISANGSAVESIDDMGIVKVRDNERYAGNTIRVTVVDEKLSLAADYVFNVDEYGSSNEGNTGGITGTNDIVLWDNYGGVGMTNRFEFYLTDSSGFKTVLDSGQMSSSNNASATVSIVSRPAGSTVHASIYNSGRTLEDNGYGYLDVYCSKEGLVRLNITIKVYDPDETRNYSRRYSYYRKTVELNMTKNITSGNMNNIGGSYSNPIGNNNGVNAADVNVAMIVGSTKYTVNMMQRELDTAPYVDNGRTFVPLRALSDGLGAAVSFDDDTQTITIIYNGERAELVIGSDVVATTKRGTYRVDTAPVIENERTMVPLRIAAEALGCQVEAVYNQYGSTIGAVFSK